MKIFLLNGIPALTQLVLHDLDDSDLVELFEDTDDSICDIGVDHAKIMDELDLHAPQTVSTRYFHPFVFAYKELSNCLIRLKFHSQNLPWRMITEC